MNMKKTACVIVLVALFCAIGALAWRPAFAAAKVTVQQATPWTLNGSPCGDQTQCQQAAVSAAQANPGIVQIVAGPTFNVVGQPSQTKCPNIGAMQPSDYTAPDGSPVFADPCHSQ